MIDWSKKVTVADKALQLAASVRADRDARLECVDKINPIRWGEMSDDEKQQWIDYRIELLDVPQQAGFPHKIDWPERPK